MFRVDDGRKRVRRRSLDPPPASSSQSVPSRRRLSVAAEGNSSAPLRGIVVCLTGLAPESKIKLHRQVERLGGRYSRDLDTSTTTHLIAPAPEGAKYEAAVACPSIRVVSPEWLDACSNGGTRVDERKFSWTQEDSVHHVDEIERQDESDVSQIVDELLESNVRNKMFSSCRFLLIGFDDDSKVRNRLCKLIRRGWGTIYWEMNEMITHMIVETDCTENWRDAARVVSLHHPNAPASVSPSWVVSSLKSNRLLPPSQFPPRRTAKKLVPLLDASQSKTKPDRKSSKSSELFRGCIFALMRLSPPSNAVDFDSSVLERSILQHGGQMLSQKLVEALKADTARSSGPTKRICYILWWGGFESSHITMHPLLSRVERADLCSIVTANPLWLKVCITDQKVISPGRRPLLFEPHSWPIRRLPETVSSQAKCGGIKVAVTGFVGSERSGIICLLQSIGATYTENMRSSNTHLICKENQGPKFEKAVEWGLHVVPLDWLLHIARFGYSGKGASTTVGCEGRFSLDKGNTEAETIADLPARLEKRRRLQEQQNKTSQPTTDGGVNEEAHASQEIPGTEPKSFAET